MARDTRVFGHWEVWVGIVLCGVIAAASYGIARALDGNELLFVAIGGGIGGLVSHAISAWVRRRYYESRRP